MERYRLQVKMRVRERMPRGCNITTAVLTLIKSDVMKPERI
jgi:hypothetical protein